MLYAYFALNLVIALAVLLALNETSRYSVTRKAATVVLMLWIGLFVIVFDLTYNGVANFVREGDE